MAPAPNGSVPARLRREGGFTPNQRVDRALNIRTSALTAVALAAITGGGAAADTGTDGRAWYLGGGLGAGRADNGDAVGGRVDFDLGRPMAMLVGGMSLGDRWRLELDAAHRGNDSEVVYFPGGGADVQPDSDSTLTARSIGASVLRRFDAGTGFRPYLGAGVAVARVDYELTEYITGRRLLDDRDTALAYQLVAGIELPLTARLDLATEYRLWHAPDIELEDVAGEEFDTDHRVQSVMATLRYRLGGDSAAGPALAGAAPRRPGPGWYVAAAGGATFPKDAEIKNNLANFDAFDVGYAASLAAGYRFGNGWRVELEAARRRNEAELIDFNPEFGEDRASGAVRAHSVLVNAAYHPAWGLPFQPFAALGVGMAWSDWDVRLDTTGETYVDDDDAAWAFQVELGAAAALTERLTGTVSYRYWQTGLFDMAQPDGRDLRTELTVHGVTLGLVFALH